MNHPAGGSRKTCIPKNATTKDQELGDSLNWSDSVCQRELAFFHQRRAS